MLLCGGHLTFVKMSDSLLSKAHSLSIRIREESTSYNGELGGGHTKGTANRVKHFFLSPETSAIIIH